MLKDIAQRTQVPPVHLAQEVLSKMARMGVTSAFHVNIVIQVHFHFSAHYFTNITNVRVQYPDGSVIC